MLSSRSQALAFLPERPARITTSSIALCRKLALCERTGPDSEITQSHAIGRLAIVYNGDTTFGNAPDTATATANATAMIDSPPTIDANHSASRNSVLSISHSS